MKSAWIGLAGAIVAVVSPGALADVWEHDWAYATDCGGSGLLWDTAIYIDGGDSGFGGTTEYSTTVKTLTRFKFSAGYSSTDDGKDDYLYVEVGGVRTPLIYNKDQGSPRDFEFDVAPGRVFSIGVATKDGKNGAGHATIFPMRSFTVLGFKNFEWGVYNEKGTGSATLPPPRLEVVGGDSGVKDYTEVYAWTQLPMYALAGGSYSSWDVDALDQGYYSTYATGRVVFIDNGHQGDFDPFSIIVDPGTPIAFGVFTADGKYGPGVLTIDDFTGYMLPGKQGTFPWNKVDTAGGSFEFGAGVMNIHGGNVAVPGFTEFTAGGMFNYQVQADCYYSSQDVGTYDRAYYTINGVRTSIADNDHQGHQFAVEFFTRAGDTFGFGVETEDGKQGAGELSVYRFRAWAMPEAWCAADCDGSGALDFFDFLCFTNEFNAGDEAADCDGNGGLDFFDFLCFTNEFNAGC